MPMHQPQQALGTGCDHAHAVRQHRRVLVRFTAEVLFTAHSQHHDTRGLYWCGRQLVRGRLLRQWLQLELELVGPAVFPARDVRIAAWLGIGAALALILVLFLMPAADAAPHALSRGDRGESTESLRETGSSKRQTASPVDAEHDRSSAAGAFFEVVGRVEAEGRSLLELGPGSYVRLRWQPWLPDMRKREDIHSLIHLATGEFRFRLSREDWVEGGIYFLVVHDARGQAVHSGFAVLEAILVIRLPANELCRGRVVYEDGSAAMADIMARDGDFVEQVLGIGRTSVDGSFEFAIDDGRSQHIVLRISCDRHKDQVAAFELPRRDLTASDGPTIVVDMKERILRVCDLAGNPLSGALVVATIDQGRALGSWLLQRTSDPHGIVRFWSQDGGIDGLVCCEGYRPARLSGALEATATVALGPGGTWGVEGIVRHQSGEPAIGARILAYPLGAEFGLRAGKVHKMEADARGRFALSADFPPDMLVVLAFHPLAPSFWVQATDFGSGRVDEIVLPDVCRIRVSIAAHATDGEVVASAPRYSILDEQGRIVRESSVHSGTALVHVPAGRYLILGGFGTMEGVEPLVAAAGSVDADVHVAPAITLQCRFARAVAIESVVLEDGPLSMNFACLRAAGWLSEDGDRAYRLRLPCNRRWQLRFVEGSVPRVAAIDLTAAELSFGSGMR